MYQEISQLKKSSRNNLRGHYGMIIAVTLISLFVVMLFYIPSRMMLFRGIFTQSSLRITIGIICAFVISMVIMLLSAGFSWIHLNLAQKKKVKFRDVLHPFTNQPGKFIGSGLLRIATALICLLPGVIGMLLSVDISIADFSYHFRSLPLFYISHLVIIAGGIVYYLVVRSWSLSTYLMLDHPDMSVTQAFRKSKQMLKGNRRRRFRLLLSFVGLLILSILSFFIALLWVYPYMSQSMICFYLDLKAEENSEHNDYMAELETKSKVAVDTE